MSKRQLDYWAARLARELNLTWYSGAKKPYVKERVSAGLSVPLRGALESASRKTGLSMSEIVRRSLARTITAVDRRTNRKYA